MPGDLFLILIYVALVLVAALGTLQIAALRNGLEGLAWPIGTRYRRFGIIIAGLSIALSFLGGAFLTPIGSLPPQVALVTIVAGGGLALALAMVGASIRMRWGGRPRRQALPGRRVDLGPVWATFYQPLGQGPHPAVCLLPDPTAPEDDMTALVWTLVKRGIAVLVFDWHAPSGSDRLTLHGLVAFGTGQLARWPEIDAQQVGLLGLGLGGDLALRSAAMDSGVAAVLAIEPVLSPRRPGIGLEALRALSWFEARRRSQRWRRSVLVKGLNALAAIPCIAPRPVAIVVGGSGGQSHVADHVEVVRLDRGCFLKPATRTRALEYATGWMKEHLT